MRRIDLLVLGCCSAVAACALDDRRVSLAEGGAAPEVHADEVLVDNFEDAPQYSRDPRFQRLWQKYTYGAPAIDYHAERVVSDAGSNWAFELAWQVAAPVGAGPGGVGISSPVLPEIRSIDLSGYSRIVVAQTFSAGGGCPTPQRFVISLACSIQDGVVEGRVVGSPAGTTSTLLFADMMPADLAPERTGQPASSIRLNAEQCLAQVDEVRIQVALDDAAGGCLQGALRIDDLRIR